MNALHLLLIACGHAIAECAYAVMDGFDALADRLGEFGDFLDWED